METASQIGSKISEVKETAEALARAAGKKLGEMRSGTADALHTVASSLRSSAEALDDFAEGAANKLDAAGCYVKNQRLRNVSAGLKYVPGNLRRTVRRHPATSLIAATALGFLAASIYRSFSHSESD